MVKIYMFEFTPCIFLFDCGQESSLDSPAPVRLSFNGHDKLRLLVSLGIKRCLSLRSLMLVITKMLVMFSSPRPYDMLYLIGICVEL